ncbi:hypothetical protein B9T16_14385 [Arthrospira sp. PCC 8006]
MVRVRVPYISPRGESPTRRLFQALQPYLTPKRLAPCRLLYLPPYSPDLNKIEKCWSWLKARIRHCT